MKLIDLEREKSILPLYKGKSSLYFKSKDETILTTYVIHLGYENGYSYYTEHKATNIGRAENVPFRITKKFI